MLILPLPDLGNSPAPATPCISALTCVMSESKPKGSLANIMPSMIRTAFFNVAIIFKKIYYYCTELRIVAFLKLSPVERRGADAC
jgi:hypothetical protein